MVFGALNKNQIRAHLKHKWKKGGACPICHANSWVVVEEEYRLVSGKDEKVFPVALVMCEDCGVVQMFSANTIRDKS